MITAAAFRGDFPEFADTTIFPDSAVNYWLAIANLLLNTTAFGLPAPFVDTAAAVQSLGTDYATLDTAVLAGGTFTQAAILGVISVNGSGGITGVQVNNQGQYTALPSNPVGQQSTSGLGSGATFNLTFKSGPYTAYDYATELFVAHNLALELRAINESQIPGAVPGISTGAISAKSVDKVSLSYDVAIAAIEGAGDLNLTIYGTRLAKLIKLFGMGPVQIVGSFWSGWLNGPAWPGPITNFGIVWDS